MVVLIFSVSVLYLIALSYFSSMRLYNNGKLSVVEGEEPGAFDIIDIAFTILKLISAIYVFYALSRLVLSHRIEAPWYQLDWAILFISLASVIAALPVFAAVILHKFAERFKASLIKFSIIMAGGICLSVLTGIVHIAIAGMSVGQSPMMMLRQPFMMGLLGCVLGVFFITSALVHTRIIEAIMYNSRNARAQLFWDAVNFALTTSGATLLAAWIWQLL